MESIDAVLRAAVIHTQAALTAALADCQIAIAHRCLNDLPARDRLDPYVTALQAELDQAGASVDALRRRNSLLRHALERVARDHDTVGDHTIDTVLGCVLWILRDDLDRPCC